MPRPRLYPSAAARQHAFRTRKRRTALAPDVPCRQLGPHCTLYQGDWQTIYPLLPRHAAVVTDPPYRTSYDYTKARRRPARWERNFVGMDQPFDPTPWLTFPEVILFGADQYWDARLQRGSWCCWNKVPGRKPADFAACEWIWLSTAGPPHYVPYLWAGGMREGEENYTRLPHKLHPAQKPLALLTFLVEQTCSTRGCGSVHGLWDHLGGVCASGAAVHRD